MLHISIKWDQLLDAGCVWEGAKLRLPCEHCTPDASQMNTSSRPVFMSDVSGRSLARWYPSQFSRSGVGGAQGVLGQIPQGSPTVTRRAISGVQLLLLSAGTRYKLMQ